MEKKSGYKNIHDFEILPMEWEVLFQGAKEMVFNEGEEIIRLNEYAPYIYYLEKGSAKSRYRISSDNSMLVF